MPAMAAVIDYNHMERKQAGKWYCRISATRLLLFASRIYHRWRPRPTNTWSENWKEAGTIIVRIYQLGSTLGWVYQHGGTLVWGHQLDTGV